MKPSVILWRKLSAFAGFEIALVCALSLLTSHYANQPVPTWVLFVWVGWFVQIFPASFLISEPAGCPNASLEALAAGIPVIATNVGGASEQVINGVNGYLTPRRDNIALAKAITKLSWKPSNIKQFGKEAKKHVNRNFSMSNMSNSYLHLTR